MPLPDVIITKSNGGLGRQRPTEDGISGLIMQAAAIPGSLEYGEAYTLRSVRAAQALGITKAARPELFYQISEYFRLSPGAVLMLMIVENGTTLTAVADRTENYAKRLLTLGNGKIKQLALSLSSGTDFDSEPQFGISDDVLGAVAKAQALCDEEFAQHRPTVVLVAGHGLRSNAAQAKDLRTMNAPNVAVVIGTDPAAYNGDTPAIGAALGMLSRTQVHINIGYVAQCQLSGDGSFLDAGLSDGSTLSDLLPGELAAFHDKGYIVVVQHPGQDGFFFSDSPTCTAADSDFSQLELVRTINKAARVVRTALLPQLLGPLPLTAAGLLQPQVIGELQAKGRTALEVNMLRNGELSALDVYIDPEQEVVSGSNLSVEISLVPVGVARTINATIGLTSAI